MKTSERQEHELGLEGQMEVEGEMALKPKRLARARQASASHWYTGAVGSHGRA